jgi:hypothetical protein
MTTTPIEMWWPSPEAFEDLTVEDAKRGFDLLAPDDTECGEWLAYWNQDEAHRALFEKEFTSVLLNYANKVLEANGETQVQFDEQGCNRVEAEENLDRQESEHEPGSDAFAPEAP